MDTKTRDQPAGEAAQALSPTARASLPEGTWEAGQVTRPAGLDYILDVWGWPAGVVGAEQCRQDSHKPREASTSFAGGSSLDCCLRVESQGQQDSR